MQQLAPKIDEAAKIGRVAPGTAIHVIDDDDRFATALTLQFASVGLHAECYRSAELFLATFEPSGLDCILLDLRLPGMHGLELQAILRQRRLAIPIIVLTAFGKTQDVVQAMRNGAADFLEKPVDCDALLTAVFTALARYKERQSRSTARDSRLMLLTDREREVLELLVDAKSTKQIANLLAISPKTVEKHRVRIFEKLEADSVPALIRLLINSD